MFKTLVRLLIGAALATTPATAGSVSSNEMIVDNIEVQLQDDTGNWRTCQVTRNIPAMIIAAMRQVASQYPGKRVRAVNSSGRIVDIL
jgi:hypothetical protein